MMKNGDNVKVLLVDDEKAYTSILSKRLSKRNLEVTTALNGSQGIRTVRDNDFDVAILDLKMDEMDGIETLKVLKQLLPTMEVIMLTGHGSERCAEEGISLGAFDYLSKPYEFKDLVDKILEASEKTKRNKQASGELG
jgi:DNA-binding NtrC family response regulator